MREHNHIIYMTTCADCSHLLWTFYKYQGEFHYESSKAR